MKVLQTVVDLLGEIVTQDPRDMNAAFSLSLSNDITPIDVAKLAIACEQAFGLALHDERIAQWNTVGDACAHIARLLEEGLAESVERSDEERTAWYYE